MALFDSLPLIKNSKFNNFFRVCVFLGKNVSNFVFPVWKLHNPYCHNMQFYLHNRKMDDKTEKVAIHGRTIQWKIRFAVEEKPNGERWRSNKVVTKNPQCGQILCLVGFEFLWCPSKFSCDMYFKNFVIERSELGLVRT